MGKAEAERLNRALGSHLSTTHETLQVLDRTADSSLEKVKWEDVVKLGDQVSKQATVVGMLCTGGKPEVKALEENMVSYFNVLQGFLLLSHGSTVGAGPTLSAVVHAAVKLVVDTSFKLWMEVVSSYGMLGMASALETLCGQSYGAEQYNRLGTQTYTAIFSLLLVSIPLSVLWIFMGKFLIFIGQDPKISQEFGRFIIWLIPALISYAVLQPLVRYFQTQSLVIPMLLSSVGTLALHIPLCWALVFKSGLKNVGAAVAMGISYSLNVTLLALYMRYSSACAKTRAPLSMDVFRGIGEFFRLALPSAIMICLEWRSFELLILLSGLLPKPELETSVLSVCLTTISTLYTIPYGLGAAASTRVSNELGAGNPAAARLAVRAVMCVTVAETLIVSSTHLASRHVFGYLYSNEKEVINYVTSMTPLICLSVLMDSIQGVLSGVARGCGWQHLGAWVNLSAFYIFGIPIAAGLGFLAHWRGRGLWIGIQIGSILQSLMLGTITCMTNWELVNYKQVMQDEECSKDHQV